jgi:23S rRNA pseudouridine1911/1915/1917 synthase
MSLVVLYEDNHLIAVHKPAGVLTQHERVGDGCLMDTVKAYLRDKYAKPGQVFLGLVHRLDRSVAGVVLFARTSKGASRLSQQLRERRLDKTYLAIVEGVPVPAEGELTHYHAQGRGDVHGDGHRTVGPDVTLQPAADRKLARLRYQVLRSLGERALVEIALETGRKHQIRLQLAAIGHPIVGDRRYGARQTFPGEGIALCAKRLRFVHPTRATETVVVELPDRLCPLHASGLLQ